MGKKSKIPKAGHGKGNGRSAAAVARRFEETVYIHEAAVSGHSHIQIANLASTHFGRHFSAAMVANRLKTYHEERVFEAVDLYRERELDALLRERTRLDRIVKGTVDPEDVLKAMDRNLKISAQVSKLLGLDMPAQAEVTVTNVNPVDLSIEALAAELANDA